MLDNERLRDYIHLFFKRKKEHDIAVLPLWIWTRIASLEMAFFSETFMTLIKENFLQYRLLSDPKKYCEYDRDLSVLCQRNKTLRIVDFSRDEVAINLFTMKIQILVDKKGRSSFLYYDIHLTI